MKPIECRHENQLGRVIPMVPTEEKRRYIRHEFQKKIRFFQVQISKSGHIFEIHDTPRDAWANDISSDGLRMEGVHDFGPETLLKLNIGDVEEKPMEAYGKIVWSYDHHAGVRFLLKDPALRESIKAIAGSGNEK